MATLVSEHPQLVDAVPGPLIPENSGLGRWRYNWHQGAGFALIAQTDSRLIVQFGRWHGRTVASAGFRRFQDSRELVTNRQVREAALETLEERTQRSPRDLGLYHGRIAHLIALGREEEARGECERTCGLFPKHWWPHLALARLDARNGAVRDAGRRLASWANTCAGFESALAVSAFMHEYGSESELDGAVRRALALRPEGDPWMSDGLRSFRVVVLVGELVALSPAPPGSGSPEKSKQDLELDRLGRFTEYE
jgi:hypothetical protein